MTTKPSAITSPDDLLNYYWMKSDLILFCKQHGLQTQGSKFDLVERIKIFLISGHRVNNKMIKKTTDKDSSKRITKNTLVRNYHNDAATRKFFVEHIGNKFKFNAFLRQFTDPVNVSPNLTYGDLIEGWTSFENSRNNADESHAIAPQFEYNQFIKDYFKHEKGATLPMAIAAWKILITKKGARTYAQFKKKGSKNKN